MDSVGEPASNVKREEPADDVSPKLEPDTGDLLSTHSSVPTASTSARRTLRSDSQPYKRARLGIDRSLPDPAAVQILDDPRTMANVRRSVRKMKAESEGSTSQTRRSSRNLDPILPIPKKKKAPAKSKPVKPEPDTKQWVPEDGISSAFTERYLNKDVPTHLGKRKFQLRPEILDEGWRHFATQESRNNSEATPNLTAELAGFKYECSHAARVANGTFANFAKTLFSRVSRDKEGNQVVDDQIWSRAMTSAAPIAQRADVKELTAALKTKVEAKMYPAFDAISDITLTYHAQTKDSTAALPPQPYVVKGPDVDNGGPWVKTPRALAYTPKYSPKIRTVDTNANPLTGFAVKEKPDTLVIRAENALPQSSSLDKVSTSKDFHTARKPARKTSSRSKTKQGPYSWQHALVVIEFKPDPKVTNPRSAERMLDKLRSTNPLTTPEKEGDEPDLNARLQACHYGMGPTSVLAPCRAFTIVLLVTGDRVEIIYVDRSMTIISPPHQFGEDPTYLVALLIAIEKCGSHALGYQSTLVEDDSYPIKVPHFTIEGLSYPKAGPGDDLLISAQAVEDLVKAQALRASGDIAAADELDARNLILPVSPVGDDDVYKVVTSGKNLASRPLPLDLSQKGGKEPEEFPIRSFTGNGTSVYAGVVTKVGSPKSGRACAVKFSYQAAGRIPEARLARIAKKKGIQNVVELIAWRELERLSDPSTTRSRLIEACLKDVYDRRVDDKVFTVAVYHPVCYPLAQVKNLRHFLMAFLSLISAVYHLNEAGILYVDVCTPNLMVNADDHSQGVLVDFDDCIRATHPEDAQGYSTQGLNSMAIELLHDPPPPRRFGHSLQSFFWCLWLITQNYRAGVHIASPATAKWHRGPLESMVEAKTFFLTTKAKPAARDVALFCASLGFKHEALVGFILKWTEAYSGAYQRNEPTWDYHQVRTELQTLIDSLSSVDG